MNAIETREKQQQNSSHLLLCNGTEGYTNNNNNKIFKKIKSNLFMVDLFLEDLFMVTFLTKMDKKTIW